MGYESRVTGHIELSLAVLHTKVQEVIKAGFAKLPTENYYSGSKEVVLTYTKHTRTVPEGILTSYAGLYIECPWEGAHKAYNIIEDLRDLVELLGPGYSYTGFLEISGEEDGDLWRLRVKDGKVEEVHPKIVWPED